MEARKKKILCVDDESVNLDFLEAVLVKEGYTVIKTDNGADALDRLNTECIDLVIADVMMPQISGFDICRRIKQDEKFRNVPVVLITGLKSTSCLSTGAKVGAEDYIVKPFQGDDIAGKVGKLIKIKDLNERLESASSCIKLLNTFGEEFVDSVKQIPVDLSSGIDTLVAGFISRGGRRTDGPKIVLVGVLSKGNTYQWYHYEYLSERIRKILFALDISWKLRMPETGSSKVLFCNEGETEKSELKPLLDELRNIDITAYNIVSYLSLEVCVVALNYGRVVDECDEAVLRGLVLQSLSLKSVSSRMQEQEDAFLSIISVLARIAEEEETEGAKHGYRIAECSGCLAAQLRLPEQFARAVRVYSPIHDVGKVYVPSNILKKPGRLTDDEVLEVQKHTLYGAKILGDNGTFRIARNITLTHHERWDGTGYPNHLRGEKIPIEGRILNIVDQYDAMRTPRPYRTAYGHKEAFEILTEGDGRTVPQHFDPDVLTAFKESAGEFEEIYSKFHC